jgi:hypothetical protein
MEGKWIREYWKGEMNIRNLRDGENTLCCEICGESKIDSLIIVDDRVVCNKHFHLRINKLGSINLY